MLDLKKDCVAFLNGLSYKVEENDGVLIGKKLLHNRTDHLRVRFLLDLPASTIPRDTWEAHCKIFDKDGSRVGKYLIVRDGVDVTARHHEEARAHRFIVSNFADFLSRFAKLDELRTGVREQLYADYGDLATLQRQFVEPSITVGPDGTLHDATDYLTRYWLGQRSSGLLVLLAPPGHGKSTLSVIAAARLLNSKTLPILIPFAAYKRLVNFEGLIYEFFGKHKHDPLSSAALSIILKHHLAVIILDGFDELCETAGITTARENLNAVYRGVEAGGKVLLTARTAFFRSVVASAVHPEADALDSDEAHIESFDKQKRDEFIKKKTGMSEGGKQKVTDFIESVPGADELASSPLVLKELCEVADQLPVGSTFGTRIAEIYEWLFDRHCSRERERQSYDFSTQMQADILSEVAEWCLLDLNQDPTHQKVKAEEVIQIIENHLNRKRIYDRDTVSKAVPKLLSHALLNTTKSNTAAERYIRFLHHTWHDFLIAKRILSDLRENRITWIADTIRYYRVLPEYVAKFLADMLDEPGAKRLFSAPELQTKEAFSQMLKVAQEYARKKTGAIGATEVDSKYFFSLLGIPSFERREIWQAQFVYLSFHGVSFKDAVVSDSTFRKCDLSGSEFTGATLQRVTFDRCDLENARFDGTQGLSPAQVKEAIAGGAIVDGINHSEGRQRKLATDLVQSVLRKFKTRNAHQLEPVWRRGFSPGNQRRVREIVLPTLIRHGLLESTGKGIISRVDKKLGAWRSWVDNLGAAAPQDLDALIAEVQRKL